MSSRLLILALIAIAIAAGIFWYLRSDRIYALPSTPIEAGLGDQGSGILIRSRLRRLTRDERDRLADQIARGTAARAAKRPPSAGPPPPPIPAHESTDPAVHKFNDRALEELSGALPYLTECFDRYRGLLRPELTVLTKLLITTDPDVGAIVSAEALSDPDGRPLPSEFDDCLRDMLQTFTLPPLPPTNDSQFLLALQLSFRDDD